MGSMLIRQSISRDHPSPKGKLRAAESELPSRPSYLVGGSAEAKVAFFSTCWQTRPMTDAYRSLLQLLTARRSIRRWEARAVPDAYLEALIDAARWAPSASNRQAYRFLVVRSQATLHDMSAAVEESVASYSEAVRDDMRQQMSTYAAHFRHFEAASLVLVAIYPVGVDMLAAALKPGATPVGVEWHADVDALASVSAAITNLLLAAHALGLGACWMTGPLLAQTRLQQILGVPTGWRIAAVVPVGFPAEQPDPPRRKPALALARNVAETRGSGGDRP
jgi:nitroreductase